MSQLGEGWHNLGDLLARMLADSKDWQTLIAGILALVGAAWTVRSIRAQIRQSNKIEDDRRLRQERAARIALPLALSERASYATDCIKLLSQHMRVSPGAIDTAMKIDIPSIPVGILEPLQACAQFGDERVAGHVHRLVELLQVQHSRMEAWFRNMDANLSKSNVHSRLRTAIIDSAEIHAATGALFHYAREVEPDQLDPYDLRLRTALQIGGVSEHQMYEGEVRRRIVAQSPSR